MTFNLAALTITNSFLVQGDIESQYALSVNSIDMKGDINGDGINDIVIGVSSYTPLGVSKAGIVYVLLGRVSGQENVDLTNVGAGFRVIGANAYDTIGTNVATGDINNDGYSDIIIGAPGSSPLGRSQAGTTYVIFGKAGGFDDVNLSTLAMPVGFAIYGIGASDSGSPVAVCDINRDGFGDVITGAYNIADDTGATYVIFGKGSGFADVDVTTLPSSVGVIIAGGLSGYYVDSIGTGDVNGDGYIDLILGSGIASPFTNRTYGGLVTVIYANATLPGTTTLPNVYSNKQGFSIFGAHSGDYAGGGVAGGDFNNDGFSDVMISAAGASPLSRVSAGASYVVFGAASSTNVDLASSYNGFEVYGSVANGGSGVATSGDVNGDGFADVIVSTLYANTDAGMVSIIFGKASGATNVDLANLSPSVGVNLLGLESYYEMYCLGTGDINGDGVDDLALTSAATQFYSLYIANPLVNFTFPPIVYGSGTNPTFHAVPDVDLATAPLSEAFHFIGGIVDQASSTSTVMGDVNGDGFADVVITNPNASPSGRSSAGIVTVVFGGSDMTNTNLSSLSNANGFTISGAAAGDQLGTSIALGYVNNDEYADIVVGAYRAAPQGIAYAGMVYVIYGKASGFTNIDLTHLPSASGFMINGTDYYNGIGVGVAVGDINKDGYSEIIIGTQGQINEEDSTEGITVVLFGSAGGFTSMSLANLTPTNGMTIVETNLINSVSLCDVNGDGINDIVMGAAYSYAIARDNAGLTMVIYGNTVMPNYIDMEYLDQRLGFNIFGAHAQDRSAGSVAVGDINKDGYCDIVIGGWLVTSSGVVGAGATYVVFGKANSTDIDLLNMANYHGFTVYGNVYEGYTGTGVAVGDINADTYPDIVIGTPNASPLGRTNAGTATVIYGKLNGFSNINLGQMQPDEGFVIYGASANGEIAGNLAIGDVNNDGYPDIALGSSNSEEYVVYGSIVLQTAPAVTYSSSPQPTKSQALYSHSQSHNSHSQSHESPALHTHSHTPETHGHSPSSKGDGALGLGGIIGVAVGGACLVIGTIFAAVYFRNKHLAAAGAFGKSIELGNAAFVDDKTDKTIQVDSQEEFDVLYNSTFYPEQDASMYI